MEFYIAWIFSGLVAVILTVWIRTLLRYLDDETRPFSIEWNLFLSPMPIELLIGLLIVAGGHLSLAIIGLTAVVATCAAMIVYLSSRKVPVWNLYEKKRKGNESDHRTE